MYINKNIIKSLVLFYFSFKYHYTFYNMFINNNWDNLLIRKLGYLYGSQDISGLIMVKNLPFSTITSYYCYFICNNKFICRLYKFWFT